MKCYKDWAIGAGVGCAAVETWRSFLYHSRSNNNTTKLSDILDKYLLKDTCARKVVQNIEDLLPVGMDERLVVYGKSLKDGVATGVIAGLTFPVYVPLLTWSLAETLYDLKLCKKN